MVLARKQMCRRLTRAFTPVVRCSTRIEYLWKERR